MDDNRKIVIDKYNKPKACSVCGRGLHYNGVGEYQCEKCGNKMYDDYGKVRNYVETHKGATTAEISFATGVSQRAINEMLRDERFEITADSKTFIKCLGCGIEIRSGLYCPTCAKLAEAAAMRKEREREKEERKKNLSGSVAETEKKDIDGAMRFLRSK